MQVRQLHLGSTPLHFLILFPTVPTNFGSILDICDVNLCPEYTTTQVLLAEQWKGKWATSCQQDLRLLLKGLSDLREESVRALIQQIKNGNISISLYSNTYLVNRGYAKNLMMTHMKGALTPIASNCENFRFQQNSFWFRGSSLAVWCRYQCTRSSCPSVADWHGLMPQWPYQRSVAWPGVFFDGGPVSKQAASRSWHCHWTPHVVGVDMQLKRWGKEKVTRNLEKETQCEVNEIGQCPYLGTTSSPCTLWYFLKKFPGTG